jgi:DNA-binding transcriptional MerR regulator
MPGERQTSGANDLMTIGELARRTGLSIRLIREYERLGLIYSAGRSEGNYRLFDDVAVWCAGAVGQLRSLRLTLTEIQRLAVLHRAADRRRLEQRLAELLQRSTERTEARIAELTAPRTRLRAHGGGSRRRGAARRVGCSAGLTLTLG